jgi:phosphate transport system permease protein
MSDVSSLHRTRRAGSSREQALKLGLGISSTALACAYAGTLGYLLLRGGSKLAEFALYPVPLAGVDHEELMRFLVAALVFGGLAWVLVSLAHFGIDRAGRWNLQLQRAGQATVAVAAVVGALLLRDHLPRFLVSLPSETQAGGGIGPEIFNTVYFAFLSTAITLPIGVGAAVYLARFARSPRYVGAVRIALDTLASLPSIVYGLFGFLVFVVQMRMGYSLFAGAFVLALLNLPLVVGIAEESLHAVPRELDEASLALGATAVQTVWRVTVPYAWPGILSALVLSIGRVFAESAPLIMTAGTTISRSTAYSLDPFRGGETLAVHLWYVNSVGLSPDRPEVSAGTAAMLVVLVALTNFIASRFARFGGAAHSLAMGARCERALQLALKAFWEGSPQLAIEVEELDRHIDRDEMDIDALALRVLALRQPVAYDLRFLAGALRLVTDLERIGDEAVNIAERAKEEHGNAKDKVRGELKAMGEQAQEMLRDALDAFVQGEATRAEQVLARDDAVDDLYGRIIRAMTDFMTEHAAQVAEAIRVIHVAKYLERVADHATNIAEEVIFMVRGEDVRHVRTHPPPRVELGRD